MFVVENLDNRKHIRKKINSIPKPKKENFRLKRSGSFAHDLG